MTALRPYQETALSLVRLAREQGARAPLLVMPTGSGKTMVAAAVMRETVAKGDRAMFLAPRRELVLQAHAKVDRERIPHGVILSGAEGLHAPYQPCQIASVDTLLARLVRRQRLALPDPHLVIVDEAHLAITSTREKLLRLWPSAQLLGLTATPTRKDGRALGAMFDRLIEPTTTAKLMQEGYLVPARYFAPSEPDLARVRTTAGDFNAKDLELEMNRAQLVGDVVQHWLEHAASRRTVVFATSIDHSAALANEFLRHGVAAEHVDAGTPQAMRDDTFARFDIGDTQVLCNCFLASYGFDLPELGCVVMARPTRSLMLYLQMIGRGLRSAAGKTDCMVIDHAGNVHRHGFVDDEREWTLTGTRALAPLSQAGRPPLSSTPARILTCPECDAMFTRSRLCPACGFYFAPAGRHVQTLDGQLVQIGEHLEPENAERLVFFCELRGFAAERGYKTGWAAHKYRERHGAFPPFAWNSCPQAQPSDGTRGWIKSRVIAFARAQQSADRSTT